MSKKYKDRSDADIIGELTSNNPDAGLVDYLFFDLCKKLLKDISKVTRNDENYRALIGEFYEYLSENNWKVLRQYQGRNNATLMYYLSYCANNHFMALKNIKNKFIENPDYEFVDICDEIDDEKELLCKAVAQAYGMLKENHRKTLEYLVIKGESTLEAADVLWQYTKHKETDWRTLPAKKVQDTLAASKRNACNQLFNTTNKVIEKLRSGDIAN